MIAFVDDHREVYRVEPICKVLPIAPSTYHAHVAQRIDAGKPSARARRDADLKIEIRRVFAGNFGVYGSRKVWRQLQREGFPIARCSVERLIASLGLRGAIRGKPVRTTISDKAAPCPLDQVNRQFHAPAPNRLWVSDFTYVATWTGFVYVAFVIDACARRIVGWRASRTAHAGLVLDALEQALHDQRPVRGGGLIRHSDRGSQYVSIKYTERLAEVVLHLQVDVRDAMGANAVNTMAEALAPRVAEIAGGRVRLRLLTNKADRRLARVRAVFDRDALGGANVVSGIVDAYRFAATAPYRAATHNKGIMNGITAVVRATGNDTRAVEARAHCHAAAGGRYTSLSHYEIGDGATSSARWMCRWLWVSSAARRRPIPPPIPR